MRLRLLACVAAAALLSAARPATAQLLPLPVEEASGGVMVRAEAGMGRAARDVADRARATLDAIAADLPGLAVPRRVEIRLVVDAEDLWRAAPPGRRPPPWAIGLAYPSEGIVVAAYRRGPVPSSLDSVVTHELAHLALGAALGERAPRWLHEGFSYLHSSDFSLDRTRTLTGMAWTGDVIPLAELDRSFPAAENAAARAYAESYDFVAFLARRGRWPFREFLAKLARGTPIDKAARAVFAAGIADLFDEWRESLRQRYMALPAGMLGLAIWVFAALLLVLAYLRKRRLGKATMARWEEEERARDSIET
jgi:Peptidase MA superfamily